MIIFQITGVLNFAFGAFGMIAAFSFDTLATAMTPWLAFLVVFVASILAGALLGLVTLPAQSSSPLVKTVATLGMLVALGGLALLIWGDNVRTVPTLANSIAFHAGGIAITWQRVLAVLVGILGTIAGIVFFQYGRLGAALRAMASSNDVSRLVGLPVRRLWVLAWVISTATATFATVLILPDLGLDSNALTFVVLIPLAAALAARFRSLSVAFCSALGLGIVQALFEGNHTLSGYIDALPLVLAVGSIALFPGNRTYERV